MTGTLLKKEAPASHNLADVVRAMKDCQQTPGVSVLKHGVLVRRAYLTLLAVCRGEKPLPQGWRIPGWASHAKILERQAPDRQAVFYQVYHDCGKPFVRHVDAEGRQHFPGHALASGRIWRAIGGDVGVAHLMEMDMDAHLLKADGIEEFAKRVQAPTLLLTALAEVHANAEMFGGLTSDSFKIKAKHLEKRGRQVLERLSEN